MIHTTVKFIRVISLKHQHGVYEVRSMKTRGFARAIVKGYQPNDLTPSYDITGYWQEHKVHGHQLKIASWKPHIRTTAEHIASLSRLYS